MGRGTETVEQVTSRIGNAKAEINSLNEKGLYDYLIINDNLDEVSCNSHSLWSVHRVILTQECVLHMG